MVKSAVTVSLDRRGQSAVPVAVSPLLRSRVGRAQTPDRIPSAREQSMCIPRTVLETHITVHTLAELYTVRATIIYTVWPMAPRA